MFENLELDGRPIPEPLGMYPDFTTGPGFGMAFIHSETERFFVRWCNRNKCGGVYSKATHRWTLTMPITFGDFLGLLKADGIISAESCDSWEMRRWIKACKLASDEPNDHH